MTGMNDLETRLRTTLSEHANNAPPGGPLAERILAEMEAPAPLLRPRHGWRTWSLPLLAAAAVAGVVAAVVGIDHLHTTALPQPAVSNGVSTLPTPTPTVHTSPTPHASPTPHNSNTRIVPPPPDPGGVTGFRAIDLTFVSETEGWALGSANCESGSGQCTALFRTTNGKTWTSMPGASFNVPAVHGSCLSKCVEHIRFANDKVGYAYSPAALFMTLDGGANWTRQPGRGAEALETLSNNVIRLVSDHSGCPGPCKVWVETSAIGATSWHTVQLTGAANFGNGAILSRSGSVAYALGYANPASGDANRDPALFVSADNGATWSGHQAPCESTGSGYTIDIAAAPKNTVTAMCVAAPNRQSTYLVVSRDAGVHFSRLTGAIPHSFGGPYTGDPDTELIVAGSDGIFRYSATDPHWTRVPGITGGASFVGSESPSVGRIISSDGRTIWTTFDGGQTWSPFRFG